MKKGICQKCKKDTMISDYSYLCNDCRDRLTPERQKLDEDYPSVPNAIFDIEESAEIAEMYQDMFGIQKYKEVRDV